MIFFGFIVNSRFRIVKPCGVTGALCEINRKPYRHPALLGIEIVVGVTFLGYGGKQVTCL